MVNACSVENKSVSIYAHSCMQVKPLEFFTNKHEVLVQQLLERKGWRNAFTLDANVVLAENEWRLREFDWRLDDSDVRELNKQATPSLVGKAARRCLTPACANRSKSRLTASPSILSLSKRSTSRCGSNAASSDSWCRSRR